MVSGLGEECVDFLGFSGFQFIMFIQSSWGVRVFDPENKEEKRGRAFVERRGLDFGFRVRK